MNDGSLMKLLDKEPDRGMRLIVERYSGLVYAVVRGRLSGRLFGETDVEECVADTFSELYLDRHRFEPARGSLKSWTARLALNNALDRIRRARREEGNIPAELAEDELFTEPEFEKNFERQELLAAVERLGAADREIIVRKFFLGQSSKEIAKRMGMTASNIDTRTHRAVKKLKKELGDENDEK